MEEKSKCPICEDDKYLVIKTDPNLGEARVCFKCGFVTDSSLKMSSEKVKFYMDKQPKLFKEIVFEDKLLDQLWIPNVLNAPNKYFVFPDGVDKDNWKWCACNVIPIPVFERIKYPIPGQEGKFYETTVDMDNARRYDKFEYYNACKDVGLKLPISV